MDFGFTEEQKKMREELRQFLVEEKARAKEEKLPSSTFASQLWSKMAQKGWTGIFIPEEYGGMGRSPLDFGIFEEALHYYGSPEIVRTWFDINGFVLAPIVMYGSPEAKKKFLTAACRGEIRSSICWTEPDGGADGGMHTTRAIDKGDYFLVNGTKIYNESHRCNYTQLVAKTDPDAPRGRGHSIFMVDLSSQGITINPIWMMWGLRRDEVVFEDVKVPKDNLIGELNKGWDYWYQDSQKFEWTILANVGLLQKDFDNFINLIKDVRLDGKRLTEIPFNRSMLAEIAMELETGRALYYQAWASKSKDGFSPDLSAAAIAKVFVSEHLWQRMYGTMMEILGQYGGLNFSPESSKFPGVRLGLPASYEFGPALSLGGTPTEIQKNIIASMRLNLPSLNQPGVTAR